MKKVYIILFISLLSFKSFAGGHITKEDKEKTIKCLGHYAAISFISADQIEAKDLEYALASYKVARAYLKNEKVNEEEINTGVNKVVDELIGQPFNKERNDDCNSFIYKLIPGSKEEIEKMRGTLE